jgi:hypothetical protein
VPEPAADWDFAEQIDCRSCVMAIQADELKLNVTCIIFVLVQEKWDGSSAGR